MMMATEMHKIGRKTLLKMSAPSVTFAEGLGDHFNNYLYSEHRNRIAGFHEDLSIDERIKLWLAKCNAHAGGREGLTLHYCHHRHKVAIDVKSSSIIICL